MKPKTGLFISTIGLLWIAVGSSHSFQKLRSNYDEPCNKTVRCKSQVWLACDTEIEKCLCAKPDEMIYDPLREKCVALIGERCKFGFDEDDGAAAWYQRADCVNSSVCGPSGMCFCPDGFYEDIVNSQCAPLKEHGFTCVNPDECNQEKFLKCIQGTCRCDPDNALYNEVAFESNDPDRYGNSRNTLVAGGICIGRVGSRCSRSSSPPKHCIRNSHCDFGSCKCSSPYTKTSDSLCGLGYQEECSKLEVCSDRLRCSGYMDHNYQRQAQCLCPHKKYQEYDQSQGKCRSFVGGPCDPNDNFSCINSAVCIERDNLFQCECDDGFTDTLEGKCTKVFGSPCNYFEDHLGRHADEEAKVCDQSIQLECREDKCSCENEADIYEPEQRKCLAPVGMRCKEVAECVSNSECIKINNSFWGRCTCNDGFSVTKHHTCAVPTVAVDIAEDPNFLHDNTSSVLMDEPKLQMEGKTKSNCSKTEVQCLNGTLCIDALKICDGTPDCPDKSDEGNCPFLEECIGVNWFKCDNGKCISSRLVCDGINDCVNGDRDNSDEIHCEID